MPVYKSTPEASIIILKKGGRLYTQGTKKNWLQKLIFQTNWYLFMANTLLLIAVINKQSSRHFNYSMEFLLVQIFIKIK